MERNCLQKGCNVYNIIHKPKLSFTNVSDDLCVTFEDSHPCASIHIKIQSNLTTCKTILQMPPPKQINTNRLHTMIKFDSQI